MESTDEEEDAAEVTSPAEEAGVLETVQEASEHSTEEEEDGEEESVPNVKTVVEDPSETESMVESSASSSTSESEAETEEAAPTPAPPPVAVTTREPEPAFQPPPQSRNRTTESVSFNKVFECPHHSASLDEITILG